MSVLVNALVDLHQPNRKLWHAARRAGHDVGRDQVTRLMRIGGITRTVRGRQRTVTAQRDETAGTPASRPGQTRLARAYSHRPAGGGRLLPRVDVGRIRVRGVRRRRFSRRILGWRVTTTKHTSMVTDALRQALQVRRRGQNAWAPAGLVHHSDAGSQYVSVAFTAELLEAGIAGSIGTIGEALDNAPCEATIGLFKTEAICECGGWLVWDWLVRMVPVALPGV